MNADSKQAAPRRRRWFLRSRFARILLVFVGALLAITLLLAAVGVYGLRYGFTPLPEPAPGIVIPELPRLAWEQLTPSYGWYWARKAEQSLEGQQQEAEIFGSAVGLWQDYGPVAVTNVAEIRTWLAENPELMRCYENFVNASEATCPDYDSNEHSRHYRSPRRDGSAMMWTIATWRVIEAESSGATQEAFEHFLTWWRWQLRYWQSSGYRRFGDSDSRSIAWRRLALESDYLPHELGLKLLRELDNLSHSLQPLEDALVSRDRWFTAADLMDYELARRNMPNPGEVFVDLWQDQWRDLVELGQSFRLENLFADEQPTVIHGHLKSQWDRMARAFEGLYYYLALRLIRVEDVQALHWASLSQTLALLREGKLEEALARESQRNESSLWKMWDRPLVWSTRRSLTTFILRDRNRWLLNVQSARLTLALRLYRDIHGHWPEQLDDLAPEILSRIPLDPLSSQPFGYRCTNDTWMFWSVKENGTAPTPRELEKPLDPYSRSQFVFRSTEPQDDRTRWMQRTQPQDQTKPMMMDPRMMQRYFPQLFRQMTNQAAGQSVTNVLPPATNAINPTP